MQSKGLSRVFSNTTVQKHQFFGAQLSSQLSHIFQYIRLAYKLPENKLSHACLLSIPSVVTRENQTNKKLAGEWQNPRIAEEKNEVHIPRKGCQKEKRRFILESIFKLLNIDAYAFYMGFSGCSADKESACNAVDPGLIPGSGNPLENGQATHSSILGLSWWLSQ